jgi:uncharacterized protein YyaL (SSP411 family)
MQNKLELIGIRLIYEKSTYLLQHAYNPVYWYPWGDEAFETAAKEDKLVFLSIGYATCHWCHVMERESFEDEETAKQLNRDFVAIKVDREERPDIDSIYMDALNATGQQGGWPLNMFLTPDKKPMLGGTYFPPTRRYGMNSFREVLEIVSEAWRTNRNQLIDASMEITRLLKDNQRKSPGGGLPSEDCFARAYGMYETFYDKVQFGFKTDPRNKFPPNMAMSYLLDYYYRTGNVQALEMVEWTLGAMKRGGIYDQIGGGLCRYSTDHSWLVPHFEKMLYDNSLFLKALVECYQPSGKEFFRQAAYDVIGYVQRDLAVSGGGIASAEDADSEGVEGKFYLWSLDEFMEVTGDDSGFLEKLWNVTESGNFEGHTILNESTGTPPLTYEEKFGLEQAENIKLNRQKLFDRRSVRIRPFRDDKVITSWNCLYIHGLVKAGMAFGDSELIHSAESIYSFISENLFDSGGRLMRRYRDGESAIKGYLTDYAELGLASVELFKATSNLAYLNKAKTLAEDAIRLFSSDFGPFYETGADGEELLRRTINGYDGVEPSGNSSMAKLMCLLSSMGIDSKRYNSIAEGIFSYFRDELEKQPIACPALLDAYMFYTHPTTQIVLIADKGNAELQKSLEYIWGSYMGDSPVIWTDPQELSAMQSAAPIVEGKKALADFTAYVCVGNTCKAPVFNFEDLKSLLEAEH